MVCLVLRTLVLLVVLSIFSSAYGAEWGTLKGRIVVEGNVPAPIVKVGRVGAVVDESLVLGPKGRLKNVLFFLRTKNLAVAPSYAATAHDDVTLEIKGRQSIRAW